MALSPQQLRDTAFSTVKRGGLDPAQVEAFRPVIAAFR
jgi:DivIVA domain-containing protein